MKKTKTIISKTSKDVAEALGLTPAHALEWEIRNTITNKIIEKAKQKEISAAQIAKQSGTSRARATKILKGDTYGISLDVLVRVLHSVGEKIKISFQKAA